MTEPDIPSAKPFLVRAIYEWCMEYGFTPYISVVVDANTRVPMEYVRNGEIVLNIGPVAANKLDMGNDFVSLQARFGGVAREISVPITAISAVYARENGRGMSFETDKLAADSHESEGTARTTAPAVAPAPALASAPAPAADGDAGEATPPDTPPPRPGGKPALRRVK
jgi:stringent starvation protein B